MKRTFAGYPLETSLDAPKDKIVAHPDVIAEIELAALKLSERVTIENATDELLHDIFNQ
jgi:hypothetical protein